MTQKVKMKKIRKIGKKALMREIGTAFQGETGAVLGGEIGALLRRGMEEERETLERRLVETHGLNIVRDNLFLVGLDQVLQKVRGRYTPPRRIPKAGRSGEKRILHVLLSDLHYGSNLSAEEVPLAYGPVEEARRTAKVMVEMANYKLQYRNNTIAYVHLAGDIIQGKLHDVQDADPMKTQCGRAIHNLAQAISFLSGRFSEVKVFCTPGNHGRDPRRHYGRAVSQKWDGYEGIIYDALREAMYRHSNVSVESNKRGFYSCQVFDRRMFVTHGDTILQPGNPGKSINIAAIRNQINTWNVSTLGRHDLFAVGHVHTASQTVLPEGAIFMSNGCLVPPDHFSISIGSPNVACGQWLWESVGGHVVGDSRYVTVGKGDDSNSDLDRIVKPLTG